jgi:hypothetical protein
MWPNWDTNFANNPAGNETRSYDVFWPVSAGQDNTERIVTFVHQGGYSGPLHVLGDYLTADVTRTIVNQGANMYAFQYTLVTGANLTATLDPCDTAMSLAGIPRLTGWWPKYGGTPFPVTVSDGIYTEALLVSSMSGLQRRKMGYHFPCYSNAVGTYLLK